MEHKFIKQSPCCGSELSIVYDSEDEAVFIECLKKSKSAKVAEKNAEIPAPVKKCDFCFKAAIKGGHLCREHSWCELCEKTILDGIDRAEKYHDRPRCGECGDKE